MPQIYTKDLENDWQSWHIYQLSYGTYNFHTQTPSNTPPPQIKNSRTLVKLKQKRVPRTTNERAGGKAVGGTFEKEQLSCTEERHNFPEIVSRGEQRSHCYFKEAKSLPQLYFLLILGGPLNICVCEWPALLWFSLETLYPFMWAVLRRKHHSVYMHLSFNLKLGFKISVRRSSVMDLKYEMILIFCGKKGTCS